MSPQRLDGSLNRLNLAFIIEDDCILHPHFFTFCGELFERYANDERIMQISGFSPYKSRKHDYDYHFSRAFRYLRNLKCIQFDFHCVTHHLFLPMPALNNVWRKLSTENFLLRHVWDDIYVIFWVRLLISTKPGREDMTYNWFNCRNTISNYNYC